MKTRKEVRIVGPFHVYRIETDKPSIHYEIMIPKSGNECLRFNTEDEAVEKAREACRGGLTSGKIPRYWRP